MTSIHSYPSCTAQDASAKNPPSQIHHQKNELKDVVTGAVSDFFENINFDLAIINIYHDFSGKHVKELIIVSAFWGITIYSANVIGVAFAVYFIASNLVFKVAMEVFLHTNKENLSRLNAGLKDYFPRSTMIQNILIGALLALPTIALFDGIESMLSFVMNQLGLPCKMYQDFGILLSQPGFMGFVMIILCCVIGPIVEELAFRGFGQDLFLINEHDKIQKLENRIAVQEKESKSKEISFFRKLFSNTQKKPSPISPVSITDLRKNNAFKTWDKLKTILKVSLIFGLMHLSPFQGWANVMVFIGTTLCGIILGGVAEYTGDLWAPTTMHIINNTIATLQML